MDTELNDRTPQILVVDDTPEELHLLVQLLSSQGYRVRPAPGGELALSSVRLKSPDLILLDINMPGMNGFEVCEILKQDESTHDIPVLFLTALTDIRHKLQAFKVGGIDYITKPFQGEEVLARVRTQLDLRRLQREIQEENARFRMLEDAAFEGIIIYENETICDLNCSLEKILGRPRQDLLGQHVVDLIAPAYRDSIQEQLALKESGPHKIELLRQDGSSVPVEIRTKSFSRQGSASQVVTINDLSRHAKLEYENRALQMTLEEQDHLGALVGKSLAMQKVYTQLLQAALSGEPGILYGETGTGKELAARAIFDLSETHDKCFVSVNCGAIQENLFESQFFGYCKGAFTGAVRDTPGYFDRAQGGTLFLDELGELSLAMQTKLLRVLQEKEYTPVGGTSPKRSDVRILAATNQKLRALVHLKRFREDLFYRLHVLAIHLPPLRLHKEDIPLLTAHFLEEHAASGHAAPSLPGELMHRFYEHDWPGNVRELRNEIQRYLTTGTTELYSPLPARSPGAECARLEISGTKSFEEHIQELEQRLLKHALKQSRGNKAEAARSLRIPLRSLHRKIKKYQIQTLPYWHAISAK